MGACIAALDDDCVKYRGLCLCDSYDMLRDDPTEIPTNADAYTALTELGLTRNQEASVFGRGVCR